jgi:hypothetical protein
VIHIERLVHTLAVPENEFIQERNQLLLPMVKEAVRLGAQFIQDGNNVIDITEAFALAGISLMLLSAPEEKVQVIREESKEVFNQLRERLKDSNIGSDKIILSQVIAFADLLAFATSTSAYTLAEIAQQVGESDGGSDSDSSNADPSNTGK